VVDESNYRRALVGAGRLAEGKGNLASDGVVEGDASAEVNDDRSSQPDDGDETP